MLELYTTPDLIALTLVLAHLAIPLVYYWWCRSRWLYKNQYVKLDDNYLPKVSIIVPTYEEADVIEQKLDNLYQQNYPKDKLEVVIVDSASRDSTPEKVRNWARRHPDFPLKLVEEPIRMGMAHALQTGFLNSSGDIVVVTDADSLWPNRNTLHKVVKWLSCKKIGAVSCIKLPLSKSDVEQTYREYYNVLRIAESKAWSTPIFHGELSAFKRKLLEKIGSFPQGVGSAEALAAMKVCALGYRVVTPETVVVYELVPRKDYYKWRIRRAQHLILHLRESLKLLRHYNSTFKKIILMEFYLHVINPWLLLASIGWLITSVLSVSILAVAILGLGGFALAIFRPAKTWLVNQLLLIAAQLRFLKTKELVWKKSRKI